MADLTRFDFHVMRFMHSEDVRSMSAEEVGQYMLLLCEAWLMGKDTTLPNDKESLCRLARTDKISPRVMKKFELVETAWGKRFRNNVLFGEWQTTLTRSDNGRKAVSARWGTPVSADVIPNSYDRNTDVSKSYYPIRISPNQTNPNQDSVDPDALFKQAKRVFRRFCHKSLPSLGPRAEDWANLAREHGDNLLLAFEMWATEGGDWVANTKWPMAVFLKNAAEYLDAVAQQNEASLKAAKELDNEIIAKASREAERIARDAALEARRKEEADTIARVEANPEALFGG